MSCGDCGPYFEFILAPPVSCSRVFEQERGAYLCCGLPEDRGLECRAKRCVWTAGLETPRHRFGLLPKLPLVCRPTAHAGGSPQEP